MWGTGSASREFLYVDDAARAIILATATYDGPEPVNLGTGREVRIRDLVEMVRTTVGYEGMIAWDSTKPDGQPRRSLDTSRARWIDSGLSPRQAWRMVCAKPSTGGKTTRTFELQVSIITPTLNSERYLEETLTSLWSDPGVDLEHIIVDGGSTDLTLDIASRYPGRVISDPDDSMYEAINKGLEVATGEIFGYVNSDDQLTPGCPLSGRAVLFGQYARTLADRTDGLH